MLSEVVPCWYELSWRPGKAKDPPGIAIRLHEDLIRAQPRVKEDAPIVLNLKAEFGLGDFHSSPEKELFGFDPAPMHRASVTNGFVEFLLPMPAIERPTGKKCRECKGKGKKDDFDCHYCRGDGIERKMSWDAAHAAAATVAVFSVWTGWSDIETSASVPQLMEIHSGISRESHPLSGSYGIPFMKWLSEFRVGEEFDEAVYAMRETYGFFFGDNRNMWASCFSTRLLYLGYLVLDCPGDACGIHPNHHGNTPDHGCEFTCHNLDTAAQQLTLLAGLAALHDRARKEMKR